MGKNIFNIERLEQKPIIYKEMINEEMYRQFEELQCQQEEQKERKKE